MKKFIFLVLSFLAVNTMNAQKLISGDFSVLKSEKFLKVAWDYSETIIEKQYSESEWEKIRDPGEWENAKEEAMDVVLENMNDALEKTTLRVVGLDRDFEVKYVLYIKPIELDKKGNNRSDFILIEKETDKEVARLNIKGDGGHWGTLSNLLGDGFEESARSVGKYIRKVLK